MKNKQLLNGLFNGIYILIAVLFISDQSTRLEIKSDTLKFLVYNGVVFLTAPLLIWNYLTSKSRFISLSLPILVLVFILIIGPLTILYSTHTWKTQEIQYENSDLSFIKIEHQIQNNGVNGYNRRTVQVTPIAGLFILVNKVPQDIDLQPQWHRVNRPINEQSIK